MNITVLQNVARWNYNRGCEAVRMSARAKNNHEYSSLLKTAGRLLSNGDHCRRVEWLLDRTRPGVAGRRKRY
jgi:glycerol kinase